MARTWSRISHRENEPQSETKPNTVKIGSSSTAISAKSLVYMSLHLFSVKEIS